MPSSKRQGRASHVSRGSEFEGHAADYYKKQGYEILEQNWRAGHKEIDLIVQNDSEIIFVEVKSSRTKSFGHPAGWVDKKKRANLTLAAQKYLQEKQIDGVDVRFDVVTFSDGKLECYPNAFEAEES